MENNINPGYSGRNTSRNFLILLMVIGALAVILLILSNQNKKRKEEARKTEIKNQINQYVPVTHNNFEVGTLGGIKNLRFTARNNSEYAIDDLNIEILYIKTNDEVYQKGIIKMGRIPAHEEVTKAAPESDRGIKINYKVTGIKSADLDL